MFLSPLRPLLNLKLPHKLKIGNCISRSFLSPDMSQPAPVVIEPSGSHKATLIFLHGLGDTGHGWSDVMGGELNLEHVKYICPTATSIPVTVNMGMRMPAWYDITSISENADEDDTGIKKSSAYVHTLIEEEESKGIPSEKIFIGGFSQGGAIALYAGLSYKNKLGGIIAMSCYLPLRNEFPALVTANRDTPLIQCHGSMDPVVPYRFGQVSSILINGFNPSIQFRTYTGLAHSACPEEFRDIKKFLTQNLGNLD